MEKNTEIIERLKEIINNDYDCISLNTYGQIMAVFLKMIQDGYDFVSILNLKANTYSEEQLEQIAMGLLKGLDVSSYADSKFDEEQMDIIRSGLALGLDVSSYADPKFNWDQMWEINEGLKEGLDVSGYADPKINYQKMKNIRERMLEEKMK